METGRNLYRGECLSNHSNAMLVQEKSFLPELNNDAGMSGTRSTLRDDHRVSFIINDSMNLNKEK
jgi:hypothetical protein